MREYHATKVTQLKESQHSQDADPLDILARRYRITDMSMESSTPRGFQDVEQEFRAYIDSDFDKQSDAIQFWQVRIYILVARCCDLTVSIHNLDESDTVPHFICYRNGLPPHPGIVHAM